MSILLRQPLDVSRESVMVVPAADLRVPPPPRRAVLRASAVTAAALAATLLTHGVVPILRTGTLCTGTGPMAAPACSGFPPSAHLPSFVLAGPP